MKIKKKSHPGLVFDGTTGQLVDTSLPVPPPDDIPTITEHYIALVGKAVAQLNAKEELKGSELAALASLGRSIASLGAIEEMRLTRVGGKALSEHKTRDLEALLEARKRPTPEPDAEQDAETEEPA